MVNYLTHCVSLCVEGKLWTAPEILLEKKPAPKGSQKGDVFSYGIILQEIFLRDSPYPTSILSAEGRYMATDHSTTIILIKHDI